ncbi:hypothetical protein ABK040_002361 [Willaertia magna]
MKILFSSDLHGNLYQYQKLIDFANEQDGKIKLIILGGDLFLKNKAERNLDDYQHLIENKRVDKHHLYFTDKILPILKQFKYGKIIVTFGNADLFTDISYMKEETKDLDNIIVLYNECYKINIENEIFNLFCYCNINFMKGLKKDFERFDTKNINDTLRFNMKNYKLRLKGYTTFDNDILKNIILNNEYNKKDLKSTTNEINHFSNVEGFHYFDFSDINDKELVSSFSIERELERIAEKYSFTKEFCKNQIWITHMPPFNTVNDNCKIKDDNDEISKFHCGSKAIRNFIESYQPLITLHGHIHECVDISNGEYYSKIGETFTVSSGNYPKRKTIAMISFDTNDIPSTLQRHVI